jgi:hypothetical protein
MFVSVVDVDGGLFLFVASQFATGRFHRGNGPIHLG